MISFIFIYYYITLYYLYMTIIEEPAIIWFIYIYIYKIPLIQKRKEKKNLPVNTKITAET